MRPTASTMLQQNNNNNYPCLNMSGSTREMLQKCSRSSLPFPSRLELGLGDLPLIRGLRAWALCSRNRRRADGLTGGGQSPAAPPAGRGSSTPCPRPADVYLSEEWGRMGYGLPLGLDARQAGIGALVTVATLKTSEGGGKTQTQCLFLRTEKGSCLYSTAKPSSGVAASAASSMVGEWLRGKTVGGGGGGGRDSATGRRDSGSALPAQTGANQVRVRSGRRWRKSGNVAGQERQQRSRDDPELAERQEEQDKGGQDRKQFPSPQRDSRRVRCCHDVSPKTCAQCGKRPERRESQDHGGSPGRGVQNRLKRERQQNEEEEEKGGLCDSDLAVASPDVEHYRDSHSHVDDEEIRSERRRMQTSHSRDDLTDSEEETNPDMKKHGSNKDSMVAGDFKSTPNSCVDGGNAEDDHCEEGTGYVNGSSDQLEANKESAFTSCIPVEGSLCNPDPGRSCVQTQQESKQNHLEVHHLGLEGPEEADCRFVCEEELDVGRFQAREPNVVADKGDSGTERFSIAQARGFFPNDENSSQLEEKGVLSSPLVQKSPSLSESGGGVVEQEDGDFWRRKSTCVELGDGTCEEDHLPEGKRSCGSGSERRFQSQESADGGRKEDRDASGQTAISHVESNGEAAIRVIACVDPPTSNPAPSLPPLASMATGLPCLEAGKEEEEEEVVRTRGVSGGQEEDRRHSRELEEQVEEERGSNVAAEDTRKEEEDEFGVFMQAEGESAWSEGVNMTASVPCGSRESVALGKQATACRPGWTDGSFHQSDDAWTAFPQDVSDAGGDVEQWWPSSAAETRRGGLSTNHKLASLFAEAFPSLPDSSSRGCCDLDAVPTLTQLLRGRAGQDQGLLDSFHDLNRMIGQRYKKANGVSRGLLLKTLHLEQPHVESRPASWTSNRRLSPSLPSANRHAQNAAKRRLSYDYNRNIMQ